MRIIIFQYMDFQNMYSVTFAVNTHILGLKNQRIIICMILINFCWQPRGQPGVYTTSCSQVATSESSTHSEQQQETVDRIDRG